MPLFFAACGDSSSTDTDGSCAGHYQGNWCGSASHEANAGPIEFTVDSNGKLTGTATANVYGQVLEGTVDASGAMKIQMWYGGIGQTPGMVMTGQIKSDNTFSGTDYENSKPDVTGTFSGKKD